MAVDRKKFTKADLQYLDFQDASTLFLNAELTDALILSYQTIFGDSEGWAEQYDREDVLGKLQSELEGVASLRVCVQPGSPLVLLGFCWAQAIGVTEILQAIHTIKYYQMIGAPDLTDALLRLIGDKRVVYVHELGIERAYRGKIPLTQLIYPVIQNVSARMGAETAMFWSVPRTLVSRLAKRALFRRGLSVGEMEFYLGKVKRVVALERAFTALAKRP